MHDCFFCNILFSEIEKNTAVNYSVVRCVKIGNDTYTVSSKCNICHLSCCVMVRKQTKKEVVRGPLLEILFEGLTGVPQKFGKFSFLFILFVNT